LVRNATPQADWKPYARAVPVADFCYPAGQVDATVIAAVKDTRGIS